MLDLLDRKESREKQDHQEMMGQRDPKARRVKSVASVQHLREGLRGTLVMLVNKAKLAL